MGIILSGKHGEANGNICNLRWVFLWVYFSVNDNGSKYWLIFFGRFEFDAFFLKIMYRKEKKEKNNK